MSVAIVYKSFKETKLRFEEYAIKVLHNIVKSMVIWFVLKLCSVLVDSIIAHSFLRRYYFEYDIQIAGRILIMNFWRGPVEVLVMGLYFGSKMILVLRDMDEEPGKITRTIMKYILPAFTISAIAIVYLYILYIIFLTQMPSNEVFSIVSKLFCLGLPVWIITGYYADNTKPMMIISILPYLYIPLICLQGYCMGTRIYQYGMTPERYAGMMLIIFEIGTLFIRFYMKGQYEKILPFFGLLVLIAIFVPGINMNRASNLWQMSFLKKYYEAVESREMISERAYERMTGAYDYLRNRPEMKAAIEPYDIYEKTFAVKLKEQYAEADLTKYYKCWVFCELAGELDVDRYSQKSLLNQNSCYDQEGEDGIDVDFSCFQFIDSETGERITADISSFVEQCMTDTLDEEYTEMKAYNCIELDEDTILYINRFDAEYFDGIKNAEPFIKWKYIDINGILLQNMSDRKPMMYFWQKSEVLWARS